MRRKSTISWPRTGLALVLAALPVDAAFVEPLGSEIQFNAYTVGELPAPAVDGLPDGGFVAVWDDPGPNDPEDVTTWRVRGRLFDSDGAPLGPEGEIAPTGSALAQYDPVVASSSAGFVAVWIALTPAGSSLEGRGFAPDGAPVGAVFSVAGPSATSPHDPTVATRGADEFLVAWAQLAPVSERGVAGANTLIAVAGVALDGELLAPPSVVHGSDRAFRVEPQIGARPGGAFQVSWSSLICPYLCYGSTIEGRAFDRNGVPVGPEFMVTGGTRDEAASVRSHIARSSGDFLVVWTDLTGTTVTGRPLTLAGASAGSDFATGPPVAARGVAAALDDRDNALVVWSDEVPEGTDPDRSVQGQLVSADGEPRGLPVQLNVHTTDEQRNPSVAALANGDFVVAWTSGSGAGINPGHLSFVRRFRVHPPIFDDDFESGGLSGWSESQPR